MASSPADGLCKNSESTSLAAPLAVTLLGVAGAALVPGARLPGGLVALGGTLWGVGRARRAREAERLESTREIDALRRELDLAKQAQREAEAAAVRAKESEQALKAANARLSHDLRSPLLALRAVLELSSLSPEQVELGEAASQRLLEIAKGLTLPAHGPSAEAREAMRSLR